MTRLLSFPSSTPQKQPPIGRLAPQSAHPGLEGFKVVSSTLPSGEGLPMLVGANTWLPFSMALRWAVLARRFEVAESTLRADLNGLRYLYAWGESRFAAGVEARLTAGPLTHDELADLREYLTRPPRSKHERNAGADLVPASAKSGAGPAVTPASATAGARALSVKRFLLWALSPASRNERGAEPASAVDAATQIEAILQPLAAQAGRGNERVVPSTEALDSFEEFVRPCFGSGGEFTRPLTWSALNPFVLDTRVRNWLMWCLARDSGLRIGEILSLRVEDVLMVRGQQCVRIVRRPDDPADTRLRRPEVKTRERLVPVGSYGTFALQAYLRERGRVARRRGSPFLITSTAGRALGVNAADSIMQRIKAAIRGMLGWHDLRHAWATEFARGVLDAIRSGKRPGAADRESMRALLVEELRLLGGWSRDSMQPWYYAQEALRTDAIHDLAESQRRRVWRAREAWLKMRESDGQNGTPSEEDDLPW